MTADEFVSNLVAFPSEIDILTEAVHSVSTTLDSRHFATEFVRRRKLADKGVVVDAAAGSAGGAGGSGAGSSAGSVGHGQGGASGWSEVAKKGPASKEAREDMSGGNFKVVAGKKKGKK